MRIGSEESGGGEGCDPHALTNTQATTHDAAAASLARPAVTSDPMACNVLLITTPARETQRTVRAAATGEPPLLIFH